MLGALSGGALFVALHSQGHGRLYRVALGVVTPTATGLLPCLAHRGTGDTDNATDASPPTTVTA